MKSKRWPYILSLLYFASVLYCFYIGRYQTIYSLGLYTLILIQGIGLLVFSIHLLIGRYRSKGYYSPSKSLKFSLVVITTIQLAWIVTHSIKNYTPTYTITIPESYTGCIYLFTTPQKAQDTEVNQSGIGYLGNKGKKQWRLLRAGIDITSAYSTSHFNEITIYEADSTRLIAYDALCILINDSNVYAIQTSDHPLIPCMDDQEFLDLVQQGFIDESKLRKQVWSRKSKSDKWLFDNQNARLQ